MSGVIPLFLLSDGKIRYGETFFQTVHSFHEITAHSAGQ